MNISNELSFKHFLSRSCDTYNLYKKVDFIKPNNEIDYDQFAVSTNLLGDSIELFLKSISHLFGCNFNATHSYEDILTEMDQNKYGIQDIISRINANRFFDGKLIHEFKYANENTTVSSKDIKRRHNQDFYRNFSIDERNDLENLYFELKDATLKAYMNLG